MTSAIGYASLAAILGAIVGASELVSRYRDEPTQALASRAGLSYMALNALVSAGVYGLVASYPNEVFPALADDQLATAILAGFGAMVILRSKFFTLRTDKGEDIPVGPDAAISAFLNAADRGVDRHRANQRLRVVSRVASENHQATSALAIKEYVQVQLAAFQNLSTAEKAALLEMIEEIYQTDYPDQLKLQGLCYGLLGIAGEKTFSEMIKGFSSVSGTSAEMSSTVAPMQSSSP